MAQEVTVEEYAVVLRVAGMRLFAHAATDGMRLQSLLGEGDLWHHRAVVPQGTANCMTLRPADDTLDGLW